MARESWNTVVVRIPSRPPAADVFPIELVAPASFAEGPRAVLAQSLQRADALAQLRVIRHRLEQITSGMAHANAPGARIVAVSSARAGEGKSTLAAQLSYVLAEADRARVLLVEATFARPGLAGVVGLGMPEGCGFSEQIASRMGGYAGPWKAVTVTPTLALLAEAPPAIDPARDSAAHAPDALYSTHFARLLRGAATRFDYVIVDAPEALGSSDASVVADIAGGVVLAARAGISRGSDLRAAQRVLGSKVVGVALVAAPNASSSSK